MNIQVEDHSPCPVPTTCHATQAYISSMLAVLHNRISHLIQNGLVLGIHHLRSASFVAWSWSVAPQHVARSSSIVLCFTRNFPWIKAFRSLPIRSDLHSIMHQCLRVLEILTIIFESLESCSPYKRILKLSTLALVCKTFSEPALDILWRRQPRQQEGYLLDGVIKLDETHLEDLYSPGPRLRGAGGFGASL